MMSPTCGGFCALATCTIRPTLAECLPFSWLGRFIFSCGSTQTTQSNETDTTLASGWCRSLDPAVRPSLPELHQDGQRRASCPDCTAARLATTQPRDSSSWHVVCAARCRL